MADPRETAEAARSAIGDLKRTFKEIESDLHDLVEDADSLDDELLRRLDGRLNKAWLNLEYAEGRLNDLTDDL